LQKNADDMRRGRADELPQNGLMNSVINISVSNDKHLVLFPHLKRVICLKCAWKLAVVWFVSLRSWKKRLLDSKLRYFWTTKDATMTAKFGIMSHIFIFVYEVFYCRTLYNLAP